MPARFVEVTNLADAAINTEAFSYFTGTNASGWARLPFGPRAGSQTEPSLHDLSKCLVAFSAVLFTMRWVLAHVGARRAVAKYGHAVHMST